MAPNPNEPIPIGALRNLLLPADLSIELCITAVAVTQDRQQLRFRLDPGRAFARYGYVLDTQDGLYEIAMLQQYLPHDNMKPIGGAFGLPLCDRLRQIEGSDRLARTQQADAAGTASYMSSQTFPTLKVVQQNRIWHLCADEHGVLEAQLGEPAGQ